MSDRDMIIAAAERVMGWKYSHDYDGVAGIEGSGEPVFCIGVFCIGREAHRYDWNPLENIEDAWELAEEMKKRQFDMQLGTTATRDWGATFSSPFHENWDSERFDTAAPTAPRAITIAALRAVGVAA